MDTFLPTIVKASFDVFPRECVHSLEPTQGLEIADRKVLLHARIEAEVDAVGRRGVLFVKARGEEKEFAVFQTESFAALEDPAFSQDEHVFSAGEAVTRRFPLLEGVTVAGKHSIPRGIPITQCGCAATLEDCCGSAAFENRASREKSNKRE